MAFARYGSDAPVDLLVCLLITGLIPRMDTVDDFIFPPALGSVRVTAYLVVQRSISDLTSSTRHAVIRIPSARVG